MTSRSEQARGRLPASVQADAGPAGGGLRPGGAADQGDAAVFLGRVTALDPAALVRLRDGDGRVTGYTRLPFGVLVSRTVGGSVAPADVTVAAKDLLAALDRGTDRSVPLPASRDVEWRAPLPPLAGWRRLDEVPADVVRSLVRAGAETLRAVPAGAATSAGESLLDHEALTVSSADRTVAVPLRVLTAVARMGFLGPAGGTGGTDVVVVSAAGGWVRLAAAYGSAYQQVAGLAFSLR